MQVYLRPEPDGPVYGFLVALADEDGARPCQPRPRARAAQPEMVGGAWQPTETGYALTLRVDAAGVAVRAAATPIGFDLLVNEMHPGRLRRAGQLVWSGGGGWVYLRGDRQPADAFGTLELA